MKKFTTLFVTILGVCVVSSFSAKASVPPEKTSNSTSKGAPSARGSATDQDRMVYVIMRNVGIGSSIPTVYRIYHGRVTSMSSMKSVSYNDLSPAGTDSVASILTQLDPSITTTIHR